MSTKLGVLCWCCLICLIDYSGDGLVVVVSVVSVCVVSVEPAVLDICASACSCVCFDCLRLWDSGDNDGVGRVGVGDLGKMFAFMLRTKHPVARAIYSLTDLLRNSFYMDNSWPYKTKYEQDYRSNRIHTSSSP
ncbi:Hypothetical predicted protein [Octopus vulgaris]|uniref:Uncharacterized protein n=1 Tax=Octopus vulgaris TaxID=6645 RepID=A0AA36B0B4_OCTVU|nr:Hypothetical predicted protein [Octopus vulgaris]